MATKIFTLGVATKSGSYSHTIRFEICGDTAIVRRWMRDEIMGNWSNHHGQPEEVPVEAARTEYAGLVRMGYKKM